MRADLEALQRPLQRLLSQLQDLLILGHSRRKQQIIMDSPGILAAQEQRTSFKSTYPGESLTRINTVPLNA